MFKSKQEIIVIQAEATAPLPTGVVFWSHDKGTAKLLFQLKKDTVNQTLAEGTIVPILLEFNSAEAENGRGRHIYHAVIEDALNGIVSIVLEDNILGYQGRVDGSIYIELPDSRSLDTAGRFTFEIKRSPIDENVPELEDYYWQGFNEIMTQYHQTIATIKLEAKALIDSLTADVTEVKNDIATANVKIAEIRKKLDDNDVFTKAESSANVIDQVVGKVSNIRNISSDFKGKIRGSLIENSNVFYQNRFERLLPATSFGADNERTQGDIDKILNIDSNTCNYGIAINKQIIMLSESYDLVRVFTENFGETFWEDRSADTLVKKVEIIKATVKNISEISYSYGSSVGGNTLNKVVWNVKNSSWDLKTISTAKTIEKFRLSISDITDYIDSKGIIQFLHYTEASDGSTAAWIYMDYVQIELNVELSVNEHIKNMIATNHVENLATQDEAETGEDNTKTMTPLRVFQAISKWTKDKFVSKTEDETVLGAKNFKNGLQINGRNVLSQSGEKVVDHTSTTDSAIQSGTVRFIRYGDFLIFNFNFQCRSSNINSGGNLIGAIEPDFIPAYSIQVSLNDNKSLTIDSSGKVTALWGLDADKYYAGSAMVLAKNKL